MKRIHDYIEMMFSELPKTKEVIEVKAGIEESMIERYQDALADNKDDNVALAEAISSFGSIDEIKEEFNISMNENELIEINQVDNYLTSYKKAGFGIATGVVIAILGSSLYLIIASFDKEVVASTVMLLFAAVSVALFIKNGMDVSNAKIENMKTRVPTNDAKEHIKNQQAQFRAKYQYSIIGGVMVIVVAVALMQLFIASSVTEDIASSLFMIIASVGVFILIRTGTYQSALTNLKHAGQISRQMAKK